MNFATKAIRIGQDPDAAHGAVINPIYQSVSYVWDSLDSVPTHDYTRVSNPNRATLESVLAGLENGRHAVCFSSGMAAINGAFSLLQSGDHLLLASDIYGGTHRIAQNILPRLGIQVETFDATDLSGLEQLIRPHTRMIIGESPTNPTLRVINFPKVVEVARKRGIVTVFDNTFASPYLQNPLDWGVDLVVHSTTKYICGHSDVIGGAIVTNGTELYDRLFLYAKSIGSCPSPFDSWLTLRGVKTLPLRMREHCSNARAVAEYLQADPRVSKVYYPGLETSPDYAVASELMRDYGGMVSFEVNGTADQAKRVAEATKVFLLAESLGGVESLLGYPALMSHGCLTEEQRLEKGIRPQLLRLSVGIEDIDDIIADLDQALSVGVSANSETLSIPQLLA